jgi:hypothetical protein
LESARPPSQSIGAAQLSAKPLGRTYQRYAHQSNAECFSHFLNRLLYSIHMILVQEITTVWSKASRGGPLAAIRNAVPETYPLAFFAVSPPQVSCLYHTIGFDEANDFAYPKEQLVSYTLTQELRFGCVSISPMGDQVQVIYTYDMGCGGAPQRYGLPQLAFSLPLNQWGQILYNGRFPEEYTWTYRKYVYNIGVFDRVDKNVFVQLPPKHRQDRLVDVW